MILPISKILCPADFSDPSYEGLKAVVEFARHFEAALTVIHAVNPMPIMPGSFPSAGGYLQTVLKEIEESAKNSLQTILQTHVPDKIHAKALVVVGTSAQVITQAAVDEGADMIVIATHGESGWKKFIMGSVTERVVRLADRPVLTIHSSE